MAQLNLVVTGNSSPSYTVSIKKTGDNTERFINQSGNTVYFTSDEGSNEYTLSVIGCETETYTFTLNCVYFDINNVFTNVARETNQDVFSPEKFPDFTIPLIYDSYIGKNVPSFLMSYEGYSSYWSDKNTSVYQKGFFSARKVPFINCVDIWVEGCPGDYPSFISALPYNERFQIGLLGTTFSNEFITGSPNNTVYSAGLGYAGGPFGRGDVTNGKTNYAIFSVDVETGIEVGNNDNDSRKLACMFAGMGDAMNGYVYAIYVIPLFTFGAPCEGRYPNPDGSFNTIIPNDFYPGVNYSISKVWTESFDLNGETKFLKQYKNVIDVEESTNFSEDSFEQGEILYSRTTGEPLRTINHFGTIMDESGVSGFNVTHTLSKGISLCETSVAYAKYQDREHVPMFKIICDGGASYRWTDHTKDIGSAKYHLPRNISFAGGMLLFLSGARGWHIWDYPPSGVDLDGYNGVLGFSYYLYTKFTINGVQISLAELKPFLTFNTWNTEQSYDSGSTWVKHKAIDWRKSTNYIPLRTAYTNDGYIIIFACRPYRVEPLSCKWRVNIGGTNYTGDIGINDWMSCYPVEEPNRKDFYFKILKV